MNITEQSIDSELLDDLAKCAARAIKLLGLDPENDSAETIITAIDAFVFETQQGNTRDFDLNEDEDLPLMLGSAWGVQLVRSLGWQWSSVIFHDHDDVPAVGVFSVDRSLAIYPLHFIYGCLEHDAPVTIALAWSILNDGTRVPELPANGFENVMEHVHHDAPRI